MHKLIEINFDSYDFVPVYQTLYAHCKDVYQAEYLPGDLIEFQLDKDFYSEDSVQGAVLQTLQRILNEIDISNFFCTVLTGNPDIAVEIEALTNTDSMPLNYKITNSLYQRAHTSYPVWDVAHSYNSIDPNSINQNNSQLLTESKTFCMYPWITVHALPNGRAVPCCYANEPDSLGNTRNNTLSELWNSDRMQTLRHNLLNNQQDSFCTKCYEQESSGIFSGRLSINKQFAHQAHLANTTTPKFDMRYWDIRFSNLCNLRCRSCFHMLSSSWYSDTVKIQGNDYAKNNKALVVADGERPKLVDQLLEHIDVVEQIYFAGGEPMMMDQHYRILEALEAHKKFDVRLIYNTNFTQTKLKDRWVFDYWKKFDSVSVGASLDASGARAELLRRDCNWEEIVTNRREMQRICPDVDFYINATISLLNALHLPDFHKQLTEEKFISAQDFNVNIVSHPDYLRIDAGNTEFKTLVEKSFNEHIAWLAPQDTLGRATQGFTSAIEYMNGTDKSNLLKDFWHNNSVLDGIRNEKLLEVVPELEILKG